MCEIGGWAARNIILDQTNVFPIARQCKKEQFRNFGFKRAIVFGNNNDTLEQRTHEHEVKEGQFIPEGDVMGKKRNVTKPQFYKGFMHMEYVKMPDRDSGA